MTLDLHLPFTQENDVFCRWEHVDNPGICRTDPLHPLETVVLGHTHRRGEQGLLLLTLGERGSLLCRLLEG